MATAALNAEMVFATERKIVVVVADVADSSLFVGRVIVETVVAVALIARARDLKIVEAEVATAAMLFTTVR